MEQVNVSKAETRLTKRKAMSSENNNVELQNCMHAIADKRCKQSFAVVFKHFSSKVKHLAYKQLGQLQSEAIALEAMQEVMTQIWRKAHLYHAEKGAVSTWIYTITRNVCFDMLRKVKNKPEVNIAEDVWPLIEQSTDEDEVFTDHLSHKQLASCVDSLPEKQKQVVQGLYFQELSQEQLARQLDIPLGTVKSRLRLAIAKLKQELGDNHD
jgi:RNA polymerase sigma-70 factor (ECF subfamily)